MGNNRSENNRVHTVSSRTKVTILPWKLSPICGKPARILHAPVLPWQQRLWLLTSENCRVHQGFGHLIDKTMAIQEGVYFRWMRYGNWYSRTTAQLVLYLDEGLKVMTWSTMSIFRHRSKYLFQKSLLRKTQFGLRISLLAIMALLAISAIPLWFAYFALIRG